MIQDGTIRFKACKRRPDGFYHKMNPGATDLLAAKNALATLLYVDYDISR